MIIDLLYMQQQKKIRAKKMCEMTNKGNKKLLKIDLTSLSLDDSEKIASIVREACQVVTLMGYGVSIEKQFVQKQK